MKDNKTLKWFLGVLAFGLFVAGLVATVSMTVGVIEIVLPGSALMMVLAPVFFDIGFVLWASLAIWKSRSTEQHGISLLLACIDGLGMALMIFGRLLLGGQQLVTPPQWLGGWLIGGTTFVILANVFGFFYYEGHSPEAMQERLEQIAENEKFEQSMKYKADLFKTAILQVRAQLDRDGYQMAQVISKRMIVSIKHDMNLKLTAAEQKALDAEVVDVEAEDIPALPSPAAPHPFWNGLLGFLASLRNGAPTNSTSTPSRPSSNQDD